jgi:pimeloyl-ACP methyl ester carboxylesterase
MTFATVNGVRLFYTTAGTGRPPLVLVAGWCGDHIAMAPLADLLEANHEVIGVDMRGLGHSEVPRGRFTMADLVEDLRALCDQLGVLNPIFIGHSLGGRIVLAMLAAHPDIAQGAVLLDVAIEDSRAHLLARRAEVEGDDWRAGLQRRFEKLASPASSESTRAIVARMLDTPIEVARASLRASDDFDAALALSKCRVPVLYIGASEPRESQLRLLELKPDLMFGQVVASGHFVQVDAAAQVAAMVERFVVVTASAEFA